MRHASRTHIRHASHTCITHPTGGPRQFVQDARAAGRPSEGDGCGACSCPRSISSTEFRFCLPPHSAPASRLRPCSCLNRISVLFHAAYRCCPAWPLSKLQKSAAADWTNASSTYTPHPQRYYWFCVLNTQTLNPNPCSPCSPSGASRTRYNSRRAHRRSRGQAAAAAAADAGPAPPPHVERPRFGAIEIRGYGNTWK